MPVILVGTKADLIKDLRQVTREEAEAVAKKFKFGHYFETSSVSGQGEEENVLLSCLVLLMLLFLLF